MLLVLIIAGSSIANKIYTDFIETLEFRDRLTIGFWGSIEKYKEWKANKEARSKSASMPADK